MAQYDVDLIVIGGGPGGYPAAIHAAKMGASVVCIDFDNAGGTCLNWGCIPTKTMIGSVAALEQAKHFADFGLTIGGEIGFDMNALMARKDKVVKTLVGGVEFLFKKNGVRFIKGKGKLLDPHTVEAATEDGKTERLTAASIILATGSVVAKLHPSIQMIGADTADADVFVDNREVKNRKAAGTLGTTTLWTSNEAVSSLEVPKKLVVLGSGAVGTEFAYTYRGLGADVTLIELMPNIVPAADPDLTTELAKLLTKAGVKIMTSTKVVAIDVPGKKLKYVTEKGDGEIEFDKLLIGVGRRAYTDGLGLQAAGVFFDRKITVDEYMRTNVPHIYAIGDAAGGGLAHVATREGEVAAENALGHTGSRWITRLFLTASTPSRRWPGPG